MSPPTPVTCRALIIEDNLVNRHLLDYMLRAYGFETLQAADGGLGLDMAHRELPDVILCDIHMPGVDGFEFVRLARQSLQLQATPIIAVTAYAMLGDRDRILAAGFDEYIAKPIDAATLIALIRRLLPPGVAPASHQPQPSFLTPAAREAAAPTTVLVLDDTPFNLELKRDLLEPNGYRVVTASTIAQAMPLALQHLPGLIISDVGMAEGSGFDFIRAVKAEPSLRAVPFIFLSATHWDETSMAEGLRLGADLYLLRPLEPRALLRHIAQLVG